MKKHTWHRLFIISLLWLIGSISLSLADPARLEAIRLELDQIEAGLQRQGLREVDLVNLRTRIEPLRAETQTLIETVLPKAQSQEARLKELATASGKTDDNLIKEEHTQAERVFSELDAQIKKARLLTVQSDQLLTRIAERRRALLANELLAQQTSLLNPQLWLEAGQGLTLLPIALSNAMSDWWNVISASPTALAIGLSFALIPVLLLRLPLFKSWRYAIARSDKEATFPQALRRSVTAWRLFTASALLPLLTIIAAYFGLRQFHLLPNHIMPLANGMVQAIAVMILTRGLMRALLGDGQHPHTRLLAIDPAQGAGYQTTGIRVATLIAVGLVSEGLLVMLAAPAPLQVLATGVISTLIFSTILRGLWRTQNAPSSTESLPFLLRSLRTALLIVSGLGLLAVLTGYITLSWFLARQMGWWVGILGLLTLMLSLVDSVFEDGLEPNLQRTRGIAALSGLKPERVSQLAVIISGLLKLLLSMSALLMMAAPWGISSSDIISSTRSAFFGIKIGEVTISLADILLAITIFIAVLTATRVLENWLQNRLLPRTTLDSGLRNSLSAAVSYTGLLIAAALGISAVGLSLANVAIVAGALSVGIGFGLQSIVNNFVSGLILLIERPIKAGDLIKIGEEEGHVRKINVRATEIETHDNASVIIPNSSLISGVVKNWMHQNVTGRAVVKVSVAHGSDPEVVREVLQTVAKQHPSILNKPEPKVHLTSITENGYDFRLHGFVSHVEMGFGVESDLRFNIIKAFREKDIHLAVPQQAVLSASIIKAETK